MFTQREVAYLHSQRLARIATVDSVGQPDVSPVGYRFDGGTFYISGFDVANTRKFKNIVAGNTKVALVIDDLLSVDPWQPRAVRIYGTASLVKENGRSLIRIVPQITWSWGLGEPRRRTVHDTTV